jgi:hypothetical protein
MEWKKPRMSDFSKFRADLQARLLPSTSSTSIIPPISRFSTRFISRSPISTSTDSSVLQSPIPRRLFSSSNHLIALTPQMQVNPTSGFTSPIGEPHSPEQLPLLTSTSWRTNLHHSDSMNAWIAEKPNDKSVLIDKEAIAVQNLIAVSSKKRPRNLNHEHGLSSQRVFLVRYLSERDLGQTHSGKCY